MSIYLRFLSPHIRVVVPVALLAVLLSLLVGCGGIERLERAPGSAVWVDHLSTPPSAEDLGRLADHGVGEVFVAAARLSPDASDGITMLPASELPPSTPVVLVVTGEWSPDSDPIQVAEGLRQLRFDAEGRGWVPRGVHLDLLGVSDFKGYGIFLESLREANGGENPLSITVERDWLKGDLDEVGERLEDVLAQVDFVTAFLYGQRPDEAESRGAWDLGVLGETLELLEALGVPYLLASVTLGVTVHEDAQGQVYSRSTSFAVKDVLWNRDLKLRLGYTLEGGNRRHYALSVEKDTQIGEWRLDAGDSVRIVRAGTSDLDRVLELAARQGQSGFLGHLFYRLPAPEERMSLGLGNLVNALDSLPVTPDLELRAYVQRRRGRGWLFRYEIVNHNGEISELSMSDNNYLEIRASSKNAFGEIDVGDFYRYDFFRSQKDNQLDRMYRDANVARLYVPVLDGQERVSSGDVELRMSRPSFVLRGQFLLPDGRELEIGPYTWKDGELSGPPRASQAGGAAEADGIEAGAGR